MGMTVEKIGPKLARRTPQHAGLQKPVESFPRRLQRYRTLPRVLGQLTSDEVDVGELSERFVNGVRAKRRTSPSVA